MTLLLSCLSLFYTFFRIGLVGFGGGYAMISMIMIDCEKYGVTTAQFADLNTLDMVVPGPIAINAATYVGYLYAGFPGSLAATVGVSLPSFFIVALVLHFLSKYRENKIMNGALSGIKPAAVGLIAAAAVTIAMGIMFVPGMGLETILTDPLGTVSFLLAGIFIATAVANICFKVNPILLTLMAGVVGAVVSLLGG